MKYKEEKVNKRWLKTNNSINKQVKLKKMLNIELQ